jgi:hypothetical protein
MMCDDDFAMIFGHIGKCMTYLGQLLGRDDGNRG